MKFTLTIEMDNAAFCANEGDDDSGAAGQELDRILRVIGCDVVDGVEVGDSGHARDYNGNRVATWKVTE